MAEHDIHTIGTATFEEISMLPRNILLRNQNVAVSDVRFTSKLHSNLYLDCIQAGITGAAFPAISAANVEGDVITDGTAKFIVRGVNPSFFRYRQPLTNYSVGDIVYSTKLPSYLRLECVSAGTTGTTEPDFSSMSTGGGQ